MDKITLLDFKDDLIEFLTNELCAESKNFDFSSDALIFPGRRPAFYLRKALSQRLGRSYFPPKIFSIEEFISYLFQKINPQARPISLVEANFILYKIIKDLSLSQLNWQKELQLSAFFLWGKKIFEFLEELDKELISDKALLNVAANAQIGLEVPDYVNRLLENILQIRTQFHQELQRLKFTSCGFSYYQAAESIEHLLLDEFKEIIFCGFFALVEAEKKVFKYLVTEKNAKIIFQGNPEDFSILSDELNFFGKGKSFWKGKFRTRLPNIRLYECLNTESEVNCAKEILLDLKEKSKTALVLSEESALIPLMYQALSELNSPFNISLGYPLRRTPIWALIEAIFCAQERKKDELFYSIDYLRVMLHPYIKNIADKDLDGAVNRILIHRLEEVLLKRKQAFLNPSQLEEDLDFLNQVCLSAKRLTNTAVSVRALRQRLQLIHHLFFFTPFEIPATEFGGASRQKASRPLSGLFRTGFRFSKRGSLKDFVNLVEEMLLFILEKSTVSSYMFSGDTFQRFFQILKELASVVFVDNIEMESISFFELLRFYVYFSNIPFSGIPLKGLQVVGVLETRNLRFKNVIILDAQEGIFPKSSTTDSLVPEGILPCLGLPHYQKKEEIFRYHFFRLVNSANNAFILYRKPAENIGSRSRFVEEIIWMKEKEEKQLWDEKTKIKHPRFNINVRKRGFNIEKSKKITEVLKNFVFSPTAIDTYLRCPVRFYFRCILNLKEKERISDEPEAKDLGNFFHKFLADFFSRFQGRILALGDAEYEDFNQLKDKTFAQSFGKSKQNFLLKAVVDMRLAQFFCQQKNIKEKIRILGTETNLPFNKGKISFSLDKSRVFLKGKLDRIDERGSGKDKYITIVDYKTGGFSLPKKKLMELVSPSRQDLKETVGSFQLPLYIYLYEKAASPVRSNYTISQKGRDAPPNSVAGTSNGARKNRLPVFACFYSLKDNKEEFLFNRNGSRQIQHQILKHLKSLLKEILSPGVAFVRDDTDSQYCDFCPYSTLCKR